MDINALDVSSFLGLCAIVILSFNFLLGVLVATSYRRSVYWKKLPLFVKRISLLKVHNWTAYVAFVLIILHPFILLLDKSTKFFWKDVLIPFHSNYQTFWVALGIFSFYAIWLVIITTQKIIKRKIGFRIWKNIHLISYITALLVCLHAIFLDPELKNRLIDFFDGEKVVCEVCLVASVVAMIVRVRYYKERRKNLAS